MTSATTASGFDAVLTLFAWAQPFGWGVEELRYGFMDAHPRHADMTRVVEAARWAHQRWASGQQVLIRCQAGLNRSGLLTALVLMLAGLDAADAIDLIRAKRSEIALFNDDFVDWLLTEAAGALGTAVRQQPAASRLTRPSVPTIWRET